MRITLTTLILLVASTAAFAEKSSPIQGTLENGLKYTILPLHDEKGHIEIRLRVNAGSVDEHDDQAGVAHMVEHLVFRGTKAHPNGLMPYLHEQKWNRGKNYNAVTTVDSTTYMMTPPNTAGLAQSFDALSQMVFHAKLTQEDLDNERKIILEEWRQGLGVGATMNEQRTAAVRADSRYTRHRVIGTEQSIQSMPATQLQQFYQTWYAPNNMNLLLVGDVEPEKAKSDIQRYFGEAASKALPERNYLEPTLSDRLLINKLQDARSGVSQVAYLFRFDDTASRAQTDEGRYERLLDRLALSTLTQRLRNQSESLLDGVSSLVVRKSDIGHHTAAVGLFASVTPTEHLKGLRQIFLEIERIKSYPITAEELEKQTKPLMAQIENAKKNDGDRDFAKWVQTMQDTVLVGKPYLKQPDIAARTEAQLKKITPEAVNARILSWFAAKDRLLNYQPPRDTKLVLTEAEINKTLAEVQTEQILPPAKEKEIVPMSLEGIQGKGSITEEIAFNAEKVKHWTLSNGDKVVWLKSDLAKEKTYFHAESSAGFKAEGLNAWQSQIASQLIAQNAPLDWEIEQLNQWKSLNKINLSIKQTATKLIFEGSAEDSQLANLLRLFYAYQQETKVKAGLDETKESITRTINLQNEKSEENQRLQAISKLRFNQDKADDTLPTQAALNQLNEKTLNAQWEKMVSAPTTFYFLNNMEEAQMKALVSQYLADFPRGKWLDSARVLPTKGKGEAVLAINSDPKDDVRIWAFSPYAWTGQDAVAVAALRQIATNKLKAALRDEQLGVYSLRFESTLNPETNRIESELAFTANPEMTQKLIDRAREVLADLPNQLTIEEVNQAKAQFAQSEKERLKSPNSWLARLVLSENEYRTPIYLSEMSRLAEGITLEKMKSVATQLFSKENEKVFITTPRKEK